MVNAILGIITLSKYNLFGEVNSLFLSLFNSSIEWLLGLLIKSLYLIKKWVWENVVITNIANINTIFFIYFH